MQLAALDGLPAPLVVPQGSGDLAALGVATRRKLQKMVKVHPKLQEQMEVTMVLSQSMQRDRK